MQLRPSVHPCEAAAHDLILRDAADDDSAGYRRG
jgi:hypothetical protein